ncbi:MAG: histidine kinase dimerization/phospho-acceptor domain-containing protein, partial [Pseudomonadota bacterium]
MMEQKGAPAPLAADRLHRVLEALPDGLILINESGSPLFINKAASDMLQPHGSTSAFSLLLSHALLFDPLQISRQTIKETLINDTLQHVFITPVYESSKKTGAVLFFHDAAMLRESEEIKNDFVSIASHELRSPLTSVKNALDILFSLNAADQAGKREKFLTIAMRNVDRIASLITAYLDIARIEKREGDFEFKELNLQAFVPAVVAEFKERSAQKGIKLQAAVPEGLPSAFADPAKLEQIFFNLIENALK